VGAESLPPHEVDTDVGVVLLSHPVFPHLRWANDLQHYPRIPIKTQTLFQLSTSVARPSPRPIRRATPSPKWDTLGIFGTRPVGNRQNNDRNYFIYNNLHKFALDGKRPAVFCPRNII
jgi:hypothetical protein